MESLKSVSEGDDGTKKSVIEMEKDQKTSIQEKPQSEEREFSKRYSISGRKNLADEIKELRFQYFKKEKENPERYQSVEDQREQIEILEKEKNRLRPIFQN